MWRGENSNCTQGSTWNEQRKSHTQETPPSPQILYSNTEKTLLKRYFSTPASEREGSGKYSPQLNARSVSKWLMSYRNLAQIFKLATLLLLPVLWSNLPFFEYRACKRNHAEQSFGLAHYIVFFQGQNTPKISNIVN